MRALACLAVLLLSLPGLALARSAIPEKSVFGPGEPITVAYQGFVNDKDWMIIVPVGTPDDVWVGFDWTYRNDRPESGTHSFAAQEPGEYELRVYCCSGEAGYVVESRARFTVTASLKRKGQAPVVPDAATVGGKYSDLLASFDCEADRAGFGAFRDYGAWPQSTWCGGVRPAGFWVWVAPTWYIWGRAR